MDIDRKSNLAVFNRGGRHAERTAQRIVPGPGGEGHDDSTPPERDFPGGDEDRADGGTWSA